MVPCWGDYETDWDLYVAQGVWAIDRGIYIPRLRPAPETPPEAAPASPEFDPTDYDGKVPDDPEQPEEEPETKRPRLEPDVKKPAEKSEQS
jgi:hypothetical protein